MDIARVRERAAAEGITLTDASVPVSSEDSVLRFRKKCAENICGTYDKSWTCPPAVGSPEDCIRRLRGFDHAVIITRRYENVNAKDLESLGRIIGGHQDSCRTLMHIFREEGFEELTLGDGRCRFCDECRYPDTCPYPEEQIPSASGFGIDMTEYLGSNGIDLKFRDDEVTLYGIVLFRSR